MVIMSKTPPLGRGESTLSLCNIDYYTVAKHVHSNYSELVIRDDDVDMPDDSPAQINCRTLCSASTNPTKRDWAELDYRGALEKRFDQPWPPKGDDNGRDTFMKDACDSLKKPDEEIIPDWASKFPGYASAVTAPLGDQKRRYGMQEICGCTMLFVVNHKRVYLGKCAQFAVQAGSYAPSLSRHPSYCM